MESKRQQKFSRLIQKELAEVFQREVPHLFGGAYISVSVVRVSPDLGLARVYLSVMNAKDGNEMLLQELRVNTKTIRHLLAQRIKSQVRVVPELVFFLDDTAEYSAKIDKLFANLDIPPAPEEDEEDDTYTR
ncbi:MULTISPECIES: 30S ribosome-binding factor RbfA [Pontibacter]|uniref:Ribosome-binding factor A n=1 Tax=Pontibacter amylolyticus TaxID=1424080 RepID=A0ABQ1W2S7_9BACT|nr:MULTISPECIES: 30S ribosome-binding factor RbfA [Pontibacter]MCP2043027.1 ribosome-binding factor A [Pontibacter sp. HSC-36F09]GGG10834.1 ribosome-binding factor A [Pontibacter amylolyticus]